MPKKAKLTAPVQKLVEDVLRDSITVYDEDVIDRVFNAIERHKSYLQRYRTMAKTIGVSTVKRWVGRYTKMALAADTTRCNVKSQLNTLTQTYSRLSLE